MPLIISIPAGTRRISAEVTFFNKLFDGLTVDETIVSAVPGDLSSYPSKAEAEEIVENLPDLPLYESDWKAGDAMVLVSPGTAISPSQGESNTVTYGFERTDSSAQGSTHGFFISADLTVCLLAVCGGIGGGVEGNWSYMYNASETLAFGLTLGGLPGEGYWENVYDAGLFAYTQKMDSGRQHFIVVNYFVEK